MKALTFFSAILASSLSFASVTLPVDMVNKVKYDGRTLDVTYVTSGGCQTHSVTFSVDLKTDSNGITDAEVKVMDNSPQMDICEALVAVSGSVDLKKLIADTARSKKVTVNFVRVQLPKATIDLE